MVKIQHFLLSGSLQVHLSDRLVHVPVWPKNSGYGTDLFAVFSVHKMHYGFPGIWPVRLAKSVASLDIAHLNQSKW